MSTHVSEPPGVEQNKAAALGVMKAPTLGRKSGRLVSQSRAVCIVALEGRVQCRCRWDFIRRVGWLNNQSAVSLLTLASSLNLDHLSHQRLHFSNFSLSSSSSSWQFVPTRSCSSSVCRKLFFWSMIASHIEIIFRNEVCPASFRRVSLSNIRHTPPLGHKTPLSIFSLHTRTLCFCWILVSCSWDWVGSGRAVSRAHIFRNRCTHRNCGKILYFTFQPLYRTFSQTEEGGQRS